MWQFIGRWQRVGGASDSAPTGVRLPSGETDLFVCGDRQRAVDEHPCAGPATQVRLGRESFTPQHRFLSDDEAFGVAVQFRREHPGRLCLLSTILGRGDLRDDAAIRSFIPAHPFVAFRPAPTSPT